MPAQQSPELLSQASFPDIAPTLPAEAPAASSGDGDAKAAEGPCLSLSVSSWVSFVMLSLALSLSLAVSFCLGFLLFCLSLSLCFCLGLMINMTSLCLCLSISSFLAFCLNFFSFCLPLFIFYLSLSLSLALILSQSLTDSRCLSVGIEYPVATRRNEILVCACAHTQVGAHANAEPCRYAHAL